MRQDYLLVWDNLWERPPGRDNRGQETAPTSTFFPRGHLE